MNEAERWGVAVSALLPAHSQKLADLPFCFDNEPIIYFFAAAVGSFSGDSKFEQRREGTQQRLVGTDFPVIGVVCPVAVLGQCPDAAPDKITPGFQGKAMWLSVIGNP